MIIYRNMRPEDVLSVHSFLNTNLDGSFALEVIEYFLSFWPKGQFVAVDLFGNIAGVICGAKLANGRANIALFAVDSSVRGQGIGGKLYETFRTECYMEGYSEIQLELRTDNSGAYRFYTRRGFTITEKVFDLYGPGENGYRMVAKLSHASS
jgi:ribosomal protein S18 acetylase RimI-like enzyme